MTQKKASENSVAEYERAMKKGVGGKFILRLYVTGMTSKSKQAILNITKFCEGHLKGRYELEVIDIYRNPTLAKGDQIVATPTLIKKLPMPIRKFIGDMSETERILLGLDVREKK